MPATLAHLVTVRSQLVSEALAYLDSLMAQAATLPAYYPAHLRLAEVGQTPFDAIRQQVQVVEDRSLYEKWLAEERERVRAMGYDADRLAYTPTRARPENDEHDDRERRSQEWSRPAPPCTLLWDEHAGERFKRAVILGDPGFGKTWLLRYEARRLAHAAAQGLHERTMAFDQLVLPIFTRISEINQSNGPLEDALVALIGAGQSEAFCGFVRDKLHSEQCVILLDAWDEVPVEVPPDGQPLRYQPHYRQRLGQRLEAFVRQFPHPRVLLTSRIVGYTGTPLPGAQELVLLAFDMPQTEAFARVWYGNDRERAQQFLAMLRQHHQVRGLARIPLMLTLMCRTYQEQQRNFPARRVDLYDRFLRGLLRDWKEEKEQREVSDAFVDALLELLQDVGYALFTEGYEQFRDSLLRQKISAWLEGLKPTHELYKRNPTSLITELKHDGILITAGAHRDAPLLFLHRTFHEYMTARHLAHRGNDEGWQAIVTFVDKKAWHPAWQEVLILLAGQLPDPAPLLELLTDESKDDFFRHRLALAALCLSEFSLQVRTLCSGLVDRVASTAFAFWWQHAMDGTDAVVAHYTRALAALEQANGKIGGPLLDYVVHMLTFSSDAAVLAAVTRAIGGIGSAATTPEFLNHLARLLAHSDASVWERAAEAVGGIGSAAATPEILSHLARRSTDPDRNIQAAAVRAVRGIGSAAATPEILNHLARLLADPDRNVQARAAEAVRRLMIQGIRIFRTRKRRRKWEATDVEALSRCE